MPTVTLLSAYFWLPLEALDRCLIGWDEWAKGELDRFSLMHIQIFAIQLIIHSQSGPISIIWLTRVEIVGRLKR